MEKGFEIILLKHPLEELAQKIAEDLSPFYDEKLETTVNKTNYSNALIIWKEKKLFGIMRTIEPIFAIKEDVNKRVITAWYLDDFIEPVIKRRREKYLREHQEINYFTILRNPKVTFGGPGFSS